MGRGACRIDRASVDLPEPVSPTMPSVSPGHTSKETPETACTTPPLTPPWSRTANSWTRSRTLRRGSPDVIPRLLARDANRPTGGRVRARPAAARRPGSRRRPSGSAARTSTRRAGRPVRRPAADHRQQRVRGALEPRDRLEQGLGVGHPDAPEQPRGRGLLDDPAGVHHDHLVGVRRGQPEIVADQHQRHAQLGLQLKQQLHDLRLGRDVQRGGRLVGDEQLRTAGQRDGDHDALPHPARQLMRVLRAAPLGQRHVHQAQQLDRPGAGLGPG